MWKCCSIPPPTYQHELKQVHSQCWFRDRWRERKSRVDIHVVSALSEYRVRMRRLGVNIIIYSNGICEKEYENIWEFSSFKFSITLCVLIRVCDVNIWRIIDIARGNVERSAHMQRRKLNPEVNLCMSVLNKFFF